jgi:hypothetical protein
MVRVSDRNERESSAGSKMRASCDEIREHKKHSKSKATLPVSEDMLLKVRVRCG